VRYDRVRTGVEGFRREKRRIRDIVLWEDIVYIWFVVCRWVVCCFAGAEMGKVVRELDMARGSLE